MCVSVLLPAHLVDRSACFLPSTERAASAAKNGYDRSKTMEVDGVMMPRPRIPEGPASPGWAPPPLPEPSPGLEDWPDHLELLEVEELAELKSDKLSSSQEPNLK